MNKRNLNFAMLMGAIALVSMSGCGEKEAPVGKDASLGTTPAPSAADLNVGTNAMEGADAKAGRGGAKVLHAPPKDGQIPAEGIVITPPDPNDPRYKPAPGMAGGG